MLMWIEDGYTWSFFFWLDLVALISIVPDVPFISEPIFEMMGYQRDDMQDVSVTRTSRAAKVGSRAGRLARLLRLVRILRIMRVFKIFKFISNQKRKPRRNIKNVQQEMSSAVVDTLSKRMVMVVLLVVFSVFMLADANFDFSEIYALMVLDRYNQMQNFTAKSTSFQEAYNSTFRHAVQDFVDQHRQELLFLQVPPLKSNLHTHGSTSCNGDYCSCRCNARFTFPCPKSMATAAKTLRP